MIYTTYFGKIRSLPENIIPVAICGKMPAGVEMLRYPKLAPKIGFFREWKENHDNAFYVRSYKEQVLASLTPEQVLTDLYELLDEQTKNKMGADPWHSNTHVALVCYEKPDSFCHRHIVARWLTKNGIPVREWGTIRTKYYRDEPEKRRYQCVINRFCPHCDANVVHLEYDGTSVFYKCNGCGETIATIPGTAPEAMPLLVSGYWF